MPTIGAVGWPDLRQPAQLPALALVKPAIGERVGAGWHEATATLQLTPHPCEDIGLLGGLVAGDASAGWIGITVAGAVDA